MSFLMNRVLQPVSSEPGESGYFSAPAETLDPHLFVDGRKDTFRPEVRTWILHTLYQYWDSKYSRPEDWSTVWIAGSGVSYQWSASRGNGDLDVLIGVDYDDFYEANEKFRGMSESDLAATFNEEFHSELWPQTAETNFNGQTYEVTFYVNPGATDIRNIHPYAAFNLTDNEWTVDPPMGDAFEHPHAFYVAAENEARQARDLASRYNMLANQAKAMQPGSPGWLNATTQAELVASQASAVYDGIHLGRKQAFSGSGSGYGDYYNFRWQYHKQQGTAQLLHAVGQAHTDAQHAYAEQVYGGPIDGTEVALRRAAMWNRGGNGR